MLFIETQYGNFRHFKDVYTFMQEENLKQIEITRLEYCLDEIYGSGINVKIKMVLPYLSVYMI